MGEDIRKRDRSDGRSRYHCTPTVVIRVPRVIADEVKAFAEALDEERYRKELTDDD